MLAHPGCFASEIFVVTDLLSVGSGSAQAAGVRDHRLDVDVVPTRRSMPGGSSGGVRLQVRPPSHSDVVTVPGFDLGGQRTDLGASVLQIAPALWFLREALAAGTRVVSICVAMGLDGPGLRVSRWAPTSWLPAQTLGERCPEACVAPDALVVRDRGVATAAAFSAMYDLTPPSPEPTVRLDVAALTARIPRIALVVAARTWQRWSLETDLPSPAGALVGAGVQQWLRRNSADPFDLGGLVAQF